MAWQWLDHSWHSATGASQTKQKHCRQNFSGASAHLKAAQLWRECGKSLKAIAPERPVHCTSGSAAALGPEVHCPSGSAAALGPEVHCTSGSAAALGSGPGADGLRRAGGGSFSMMPSSPAYAADTGRLPLVSTCIAALFLTSSPSWEEIDAAPPADEPGADEPGADEPGAGPGRGGAGGASSSSEESTIVFGGGAGGASSSSEESTIAFAKPSASHSACDRALTLAAMLTQDAVGLDRWPLLGRSRAHCVPTR